MNTHEQEVAILINALKAIAFDPWPVDPKAIRIAKTALRRIGEND